MLSFSFLNLLVHQSSQHHDLCMTHREEHILTHLTSYKMHRLDINLDIWQELLDSAGLISLILSNMFQLLNYRILNHLQPISNFSLITNHYLSTQISLLINSLLI